MKRLLSVYVLVVSVLALVSCERRPLLDPDGNTYVKVHLNTDSINNVTCNIYNENISRPVITSDMFRVFLYDKTGSPLLTQKFLPEKSVDERGFETLSGPIYVSQGLYGLLAYNFDVDATHIGNEGSIHTVKAYTDEIPLSLYSRFGSRADGFGKVYYQPEHVMVATRPELRIGAHHDDVTIEMDAHTVIQSYYIQIRITGYESLASNAAPQAVLSGLSNSVLLNDGTPAQEPASVYFELQRGRVAKSFDSPQMVLCAVFNTFGRIDDTPSELLVTFSALTRDGKIHQKTVDMAPVFETEDARLRNWLLIDEVWELPENVDEGGGFGPMVSDWEDIEEIIPI